MPANSEPAYPIGTPGEKWNDSHRQQWLAKQSIQRSYQDLVVTPLRAFDHIELVQYGALGYDSERYPLLLAKSLNWQDNNPLVLVTGGVHGYETSGVFGALQFIGDQIQKYQPYFNIIVAPCISPWAFETINRWNPKAIDPNRSFAENSPADESRLLMEAVKQHIGRFKLHVDLHETTDTDNTEFRPALSARDNVHHEFWEIPDGFYLVGDSENPRDDFQKSIIDAVAKVTHIAPADEDGRIIGEKTTQPGVINYATKALGLCTGFSDAEYNTTTEVYPDSPKVDDANCNQAQVTAITAALDYLRR